MILYLNAEVGGVDTVKDKKRKNIKIKTTNANRKQQQQKKIILLPRWDSNHDRLRGKRRSYPLEYCIIWVIKRSMRYSCEFLFIVWVTSSDNILRFLANSNFLNQQKGRGSLSVRKMNLRSHETSVSIVTQAICTGIF